MALSEARTVLVRLIMYRKLVSALDSLEALKLLRGLMRGKHNFSSLPYHILSLLKYLSDIGCSVEFLWIPRHVGLLRNDRADGLAKTVSPCLSPRRLRYRPRIPLVIFVTISYHGAKSPGPTILIPPPLHLEDTTDHFDRMKWTIPRDCWCGGPERSFYHIINECSLFSNARPRFFSHINSIAPITRGIVSSLDGLVFNPTVENIREIELFFNSPNVKITL